MYVGRWAGTRVIVGLTSMVLYAGRWVLRDWEKPGRGMCVCCWWEGIERSASSDVDGSRPCGEKRGRRAFWCMFPF